MTNTHTHYIIYSNILELNTTNKILIIKEDDGIPDNIKTRLGIVNEAKITAHLSSFSWDYFRRKTKKLKIKTGVISTGNIPYFFYNQVFSKEIDAILNDTEMPYN